MQLQASLFLNLLRLLSNQGHRRGTVGLLPPLRVSTLVSLNSKSQLWSELLRFYFNSRKTEMSVEGPDEIVLHRVHIRDSTAHPPLLLCLQETLNRCSKSVETGDYDESTKGVQAVVDFLGSVCDTAESGLDNGDDSKEKDAVEVLTEIHRYISSPSLDQAVVDALSFELPKAVAKFSGISDKCREIAGSVIDHLLSTCSPREMFSILCEALDSPSKMFKKAAYFSPLLSGFSRVFLCIQRCHFEQIKVAVPGILNVLKAITSESDADKDSVKDLIVRAISIATSMQAVCQKLEGGRKEELVALLALFVLQIMALVSSGIMDEALSCIPFVEQLSRLLPFCGLSYLGLITGGDVDASNGVILGEGSDDFENCFSLVKHGASLAVIWGHISDEVVKAAEEDLTLLRDKLLNSQTKKWQAIGMLQNILSSSDQPWLLKRHAIEFLLCITEKNSTENRNGDIDCQFYIPGLFATLKAIEKIVIYASDAEVRKKAFTALKRVLASIPAFHRFDLLKALVTNNRFPSMIAILIDLVRAEMAMENPQKVPPSSPFWSPNVLEFIELVLKPPKGGPPSLPEHSDAVLSALNLYRYILIMESTGK
ncbi:PREDICTED: aberrant root formation protein 4 isoform X2 [Nelumbo nucifera]|nr:PREDICTED: aberrant root formation protein 4 isoform X2 [Nelumbo nucifera]